MRQVEEFESPELRNDRFAVLKAQGTPNLERYSEPVQVAVSAAGRPIWEDRFYVTFG